MKKTTYTIRLLHKGNPHPIPVSLRVTDERTRDSPSLRWVVDFALRELHEGKLKAFSVEVRK